MALPLKLIFDQLGVPVRLDQDRHRLQEEVDVMIVSTGRRKACWHGEDVLKFF
jgi:hypothetical protein